jgi:group I intron endonuclease
MFVYKITNQVNGKVYIGITTKSIEERWRGHIAQCNQGNKRHLYMAIRKYGIDNFVVEQIDSVDDEKTLGLLEQRYILEYGSFGKKGYNMCAGGIGPRGLRHSKATRDKIKAKVANRPPVSEETRQKCRLASLGRKMTVESIEKRALQLRGKKRTEEQKANISTGRIGKGLKNTGARKYPKELLLSVLDMLKEGKTPTFVAALTGLSQPYVSRLKNNHRGVTLLGDRNAVHV